MKICVISIKNMFKLKEDRFISKGFLYYEDIGFLGFKNNDEIEKLIFIGFKTDNEFDGYVYNLGEKDGVLVIGPEPKEEKRYLLDRALNIYRTLKEIWRNRGVFKDVDLFFANFFEYVPFIFVLLKIINPKARFVVYILGDYPELNYQKNRNIFFKVMLVGLQKIAQFLSNENWLISEHLFRKYSTKKSILVRNSSLRGSEIGNPQIINSQQLRLLFVGRFAKEKNPHIPIKIAKRLKQNGVNAFLTMVGDGALKDELINMLKSNNVDNVALIGWVKKREEILKIYSESQILILPSKKGEGFPFVVLEAMSQGEVVIASKCGGPEEMIRNGENGFLIDIDSEEKFIDEAVNKIQFLIDHPEIFALMSQKAVERSKEFTIEKCIAIQRSRILSIIGDRFLSKSLNPS